MKKRYIIFLALIGMIVVMITLPPVLPVVQLPGEILIPFHDGPLATFGGLTNTFVGTALAYLVLIILFFVARARSRTADEVPTGFYNFIEMVVEGAFGFVENSAGKWAKTFFPFFLTFVLLILVANWIELIPGVDSIGKWEDLPHHKSELAYEAAIEDGASEDEAHLIEEETFAKYDNTGDLQADLPVLGTVWLKKASTNAEGEKPEEADWTIVPFVRAAATDLNFTFALAIISVVFTQFYGFKAQGLGYLSKFFNFKADEIAKNPLGLMDTLVGILEFISEISKILSFAFRLFGNIFAGQVLLFVIGSLAAVANVGVFGLELFVGAIQAAVFAMLTLTFMTQAVQSHH